MSTSVVIKTSINAQTPRAVTVNGRTAIIYRVAMHKAGRYPGNGADQPPYTYPAEVIKASVSGWNGIPITRGHPPRHQMPFKAVDGDSRVIGVIANAHFDETTGTLMADAALYVDKAASEIARVSSGKRVEVSSGAIVGLSSRDNTGRVDFLIPDHLAILEHGNRGLCDWNMGCGVRNNQGAFAMATNEKDKLAPVNADEFEAVLNGISEPWRGRIVEALEYESADRTKLVTSLNAHLGPDKAFDENTINAMPTSSIRQVANALGVKLCGEQVAAAANSQGVVHPRSTVASNGSRSAVRGLGLPKSLVNTPATPDKE